MSPKKIIHILVGKANPNTMNGVNKVVHNLATELHKTGFDVEVWGITNTPNKVRHSHIYQLCLHKSSIFKFKLPNSLQMAIKKLDKNTIVHLHSVFLPELFTVSRELKKKGIPWVLSPHSGYETNSLCKNKILKTLYIWLFEKKLVREAVKIHAIGVSEVKDILRIAPDQIVELIPNGQAIEDVIFNPVGVGRPKSRPLFGFCGRLVKEHKGLDLLLNGFAVYKNNGGLGELWLIGDGNDRQYLESIVEEKNLKNSVKFLGAQYGDKKLSNLAALDVFVHTSRWEGLSMSVLEACSLAKPLLISKETNMGEYVEKYCNGYVLSENTSQEIEKALFWFEKKFDQVFFVKLGKSSLELITKELNWVKISEKVVEKLY